MSKVRGWLYVSLVSATFVQDNRSYKADTLPWRKLTDPALLNRFLSTFPPIMKDTSTSLSKYYLEQSFHSLERWFENLDTQEVDTQG